MDLPNKQDPPTTEEKREIIPVVQGELTKRPATRRFFDFVFAESPKDISKRIGREVVVPKIKAGIEEAIGSFVHGMFWGQGSAPISSMVKGTVLRGGTNLYHASGNTAPSGLQQAQAQTQGSTGNYEDVVCGTLQAAETLLANLFDTFNRYNVVSVGDLYEMARIPTQISHNAYGWRSLDGARISKVRDGYVVELPRPTLI
jgi:hypothetical protein